MSARNQLFDAYAEWRAFTITEGEAMRDSDWPRVEQCQEAKKQLQPAVTRLTGAVQYEWAAAGRDPAELQKDMRAVIGELIVMETQNGAIMAEKRQEAEAKRIEFRSARLNLQRIRGSYGGIAPARRRLEQAV
jgi:hypothetical protein